MLSTHFFTLAAAALVVSASIPEKRANLATVYSSCVNAKQVALTFDDGPYIYLNDVSDKLTAAGAKGTFFFNGNNYDCIYDSDSIARVKYAYNAGHMIGDHTWAHADLTTLSTTQIEDAMYRMEEAFSRIIGVKPAFMRPPYGNYNDNIRAISFARNQSLALWDQDTGDSDGATVAQSKQVYTDAVNQKLNNMLVLNHETHQSTADQVLPYAINLLQSHGYELVTLAECLNLAPYKAIGVPQTGSWSCDGTPDPETGCSGSQCETGVPPSSSSSSTSTSSSSSTTSTSATPTPTGKSIRPGASSNLCLHATHNADNAVVEVNTCGSTLTNGQTWTYVGGTLQVYGNKCLDVTSGSTANGNKMQINTCSAGDTNQQFTVTADSRIAWTGKGECLDLTGGVATSGTVIQMWACVTHDNDQVWNFV